MSNGNGVPWFGGGYSSPPHPDVRPTPPPDPALPGPQDGAGIKRKRRRTITALVIVLALIVAAFVAFMSGRGGGALTRSGVTADMSQGLVLRPAAGQGWNLAYSRGPNAYRISGLSAGDTFTSTIILTNSGSTNETLSSVTTSATQAISGISPAYVSQVPALARTQRTGSATIVLSPGASTTAFLTWKVRSCPAGSGTASVTPTSVTASWATSDAHGTTSLALPYGLELADAPSCAP